MLAHLVVKLASSMTEAMYLMHLMLKGWLAAGDRYVTRPLAARRSKKAPGSCGQRRSATNASMKVMHEQAAWGPLKGICVPSLGKRVVFQWSVQGPLLEVMPQAAVTYA
jgi:hypothetical protein